MTSSSSLLTRVKSKLFIPSHRRSLNVLEGEYRSVSFGRSTDFEDLREYEPGDEIKDIDWKATARTSSPLIRRYIASRRHTVMLVADTGKNMKAVSESLEPKSSLAILSLGILGYLTVRHHDSVMALFGDSKETITIKAKATESHLERILQAINSLSARPNSGQSNIMEQLNTVMIHYPQRMIIIVVADEFEPNEKNLNILRTLRAKHDIMWISIADADPIQTLHLKKTIYDVSDMYEIPEFIKDDKELISNFADEESQRKQEMKFALDGLHIPQVEITDSESVIGKLISLLKRRRKHRGF